MKTSKSFNFVLTITVMVIVAASVIIGCRKENPGELTAGSSVQTTVKKAGNPQAAFYSPLVNNKAYVVTVEGLCEPGVGDSWLAYFTASTGAGTTVTNNDQCQLTGVSHSFMDCSMYVTSGTNASYSYLYYVGSLGQCIQIGKLWVDQYFSAPFYVEEIECDNSGNIFFLKKGDPGSLYKLTSAQVTGSTGDLVPTLVGHFSQSRWYTRESLCFNPAGSGTMYLTCDQSSTNTTVYTVNLTNAALTSVVTYLLPNANTNSISTYYSGGYIYLIRDDGSTGNGYVYRLGNPVVTLSYTVPAGTFHDATYRGGICNQ